MLGTSARGNLIWGICGAGHEYVIGLKAITLASEAEGYAKLRVLDEANPDLNATNVSLGVLGVLPQVNAVVFMFTARARALSMMLVVGGVAGVADDTGGERSREC
ncbi:uncharacterized protein A4U43_C07F11740 [Asparagus officinalis]|uniref:Uncharacterized protein n=1 Tax=Asparagus officinalis TaxID=4686 RepID=A0A5P1EB93_ASPOF|nr:uncharacterized protein A4U43_C07F11740 [Asparagus officinalis]